MKSSIKNILKDGVFLPLDGTENNEYKIPIYQRHYDWETEHIINLFTDIGEAVEIKKPHYTGSFLLTKEKKFIVIDGQQRMISTFLLLKGFQLCCESKAVKESINSIFFTDPAHPYGDYLRLEVSSQDRDLFVNIICSKRFESIQNNGTKLYANFKLGYDYFKKLREEYSDEDILKYGFESLQICELVIEKEVDDEAQKIFRDLNSKGQSLKNSDLIRNFLLMSREDLYYSHWHNIELMFTIGNEFQSDLFEEFIFNYVLMKRPEKTNENKIFNAYVSYCENDSDEFMTDGEFDREKAVIDLYEYAKIFKLFLNINIYPEERNKYNETISLLKELRDMDQKTAYPFLMRVFYDQIHENIIDIKTLNNIINLVVVYYVRAVFRKISSGSRRGYMLVMYKNIFENVPNNKTTEIYYKAIFKYLHENGRGSRMPTEKEFLDSIMEFNLYGNRPVCRHILKVIVNSRYPSEYGEKIKVEKPTIEHLLPQTPSDKWKDELGGKKKLAEAMEYVDTLGNLSLANHDKNSELGNKSRKEKAEILKKYGEALSVLNKDFIELDKFSLDFIKQRAKKLIKILKDRFYIDETIKTDRIYFDDYDIFMGRTEWCDELKGRVPTYVEIEGNSYQTPSFYHVGLEMFAYFGRNYKEKLTELATHSPTWSHPILVPLAEQKHRYNQIPETEVCYYVENGGSNFFTACRVAKELGINLDEIRLSLRKQTIDPNDLKFERVDDLSTLDLEGLELLSLTNNDEVLGEGYFTGKKMLVLAGATMRKETKDYFNDCFVVVRRQLIETGIVNTDYKFVTNCLFGSRTAASNALLGRNSNGRDEWRKVSDGKPLD